MSVRSGSTTMKHSILLYTESSEPSGVGEHMLALAAGLRAQYRLLLACPPTPAGIPLLARARAPGPGNLTARAPGRLSTLARGARH